MTNAEWLSQPRAVVGLMTGTSLDGIDVALCTIDETGSTISLDISGTVPYSEQCLFLLDQLLGHATYTDEAPPNTLQLVSDLNMQLCHDYVAAINEVIGNVAYDAIGMHGQTLWHNPPVSTLQAGSGSALATMLHTTVVHDFRSADIAAGGQGAPLVPIYDHAFLTSTDTCTVALNIGGMANVTILKPHSTIDVVRAFDTGPGNVLINASIQQTFGKKIDTDGRIGRSGQVLKSMLVELMAHPYYAEEPPKSTGREVFNAEYVRRLSTKYGHPSMPLEDIVSTWTEVTAWSIADHIRRYAPDATSVVAAGGGVHNTYLMERLQSYLGTDVAVTIYEHADEKEAMCFAYLAWRTLAGLPSNVPTVTGASRAVVCGSISLHRS